jgi:hypothetical protein
MSAPLKFSKVPLTKSELLKYFYRYPIVAIPIVNKDKKIIGILTKKDLIAISGELSNLNTSLSKVTPECMIPIDTEKDFNVLQGFIMNYKKIDTLPVIDDRGKLVAFWRKIDLICAWEGESIFSHRDWSMIFDEFRNPAVLTDFDGKIVYFNPKFQDLFLKDKKRLKFLGKPLSSVVKSLPVEIEKPIHNGSVKIKGQNFSYDGIPLIRENFLIGILYIFSDLKDSKVEIQRLSHKKTLTLAEQLKFAEKEAIKRALALSKGDIKKSASMLGITERSLKIKAKKLNINLKI